MFKFTLNADNANKVGTSEYHNIDTSVEYLQWLSEGNTPLPADPLPPAPIASISPRQIRQVLTGAGLRQAVESAVAAGDQHLKDWWEYSTAFDRDNAQVIAMGSALGQTPEQLDALWIWGAGV